MDPEFYSNLPALVAWARKNARLAVICAVLNLLFYGIYSFVGGYATRVGESFSGPYNTFTHSVAIYSVVDAVLHDYLIKYSASRIAVGRFHNNIHDISNNAMFYVSFETILAAPGVSSDAFEVANLSASMFGNVLPKLLDNQAVLLDTHTMAVSPLRELAMRRGSRVLLFIPVRDLSDHLIAMIAMSWMSEADVPLGDERQAMITTMAAASVRIGGYLSMQSR